MDSAGDLETAIEVLSARGWLAGRPPELRATLAELARLRDYSAGEALYRYGDAPNGIFGLVRGALDITIPRADGLDVTVHRADPGFWIGDLALIAGQTRLVTVIAAEPAQVVHLPDRSLRRLLQANPAWYPDFYALTHENMSTALRLLANLATTPSEARVAVRLLLHDEAQSGGRGELRLSQVKLAELVALSLPTLQRVLRRLQDDRLVELGYGRIRILDRRGLLSLCGGAGFPGVDED
jgi:CRP-like cAMP-binding protein